jgi:AraC-like DNA-binding protein
MFQSILRFQRVLHLASRFPAASRLAHVAAEAGYADQSHMTREVRRFSRKSPTALLGSARCTLGMSEFFCATDASS